ncbi:MAG: hypothetical protein Q4B32_11440, partial [Clostridia bacterium]|nr:hypothetical protein [Clostridia bacterium]
MEFIVFASVSRHQAFICAVGHTRTLFPDASLPGSLPEAVSHHRKDCLIMLQTMKDCKDNTAFFVHFLCSFFV